MSKFVYSAASLGCFGIANNSSLYSPAALDFEKEHCEYTLVDKFFYESF